MTTIIGMKAIDKIIFASDSHYISESIVVSNTPKVNIVGNIIWGAAGDLTRAQSVLNYINTHYAGGIENESHMYELINYLCELYDDSDNQILIGFKFLSQTEFPGSVAAREDIKLYLFEVGEGSYLEFNEHAIGSGAIYALTSIYTMDMLENEYEYIGVKEPHYSRLIDSENFRREWQLILDISIHFDPNTNGPVKLYQL